jgi:alpha-L-arabinofuranosidase
VLITTSKDKQTLFVIAANGTWDEDIPLAISLKDGKFGKLQSQPVLLSNDDLNASPMLNATSDFVHSHNVEVSADSIKTVLPRHSVLFIAIPVR